MGPMFDSVLISLGLTADAAAAHRHEFSTPSVSQSESPATVSSPLTLVSRSPLSLNTLGFPLPGQSKNSSRESNPIPPTVTSPNSKNPHPPRDEAQDTDNDDNSSVVTSQHGSVSSISTRKRRNRSKTTYQLAHPPTPTRHRRLRPRPRLLLQLRELSNHSRPVPIFDVIPPGATPRLTPKSLKKCNGKQRLGPSDFLVISSDSYELRGSNALEDEPSLSSDDDNHDHREPIAAIYHLPRDDSTPDCEVEISFLNGGSWQGTARPNGMYEFTTIGSANHPSRTVRWVSRGKKARRAGIASPEEMSKRLTFSVITPNSRRHPVLAAMTSTCIDVYDEYAMPTVSPAVPSRSIGPVVQEERKTGQAPIPVESSLRMLILVTGIWVAFREGWLKNHPQSGVTTRRASLSDFPLPSTQRSLTSPQVDKGTGFDKLPGQMKSDTIDQSHTLSPAKGEAMNDISWVPVRTSKEKKHVDRRSTSAILGEKELTKEESTNTSRFRGSLQLRSGRRLSNQIHRWTGNGPGKQEEEKEEEREEQENYVDALSSPPITPSLTVTEAEPKSPRRSKSSANSHTLLNILSSKSSSTALSVSSTTPSTTDGQKAKRKHWQRLSDIFSRNRDRSDE